MEDRTVRRGTAWIPGLQSAAGSGHARESFLDLPAAAQTPADPWTWPVNGVCQYQVLVGAVRGTTVAARPSLRVSATSARGTQGSSLSASGIVQS